MSRFHGLIGSNPERKEIAKQVETECTSILWQVNAAAALLHALVQCVLQHCMHAALTPWH